MYLEQSDEKDINGLPSSASLHFLWEYDKPIKSHTFKKEELLATQKIEAVADGIQQKKFEPIKGRHCEWCDYKFFACHAWEDENKIDWVNLMELLIQPGDMIFSMLGWISIIASSNSSLTTFILPS